MRLSGPTLRRAWFSLSILSVGALPACAGRTDSASAWDGATRDSAGITIVENHGTPAWTEGEAWRFDRVLRIGVREGDLDYQFGEPTGAVILSDGRVVIGDAQYHTVRFFEPDGTFQYSVGREGQGPGEFSGFINILLGPGDTILAFDRRTMQANRIGPDGTWLGSFSNAPRDGYYAWAWDDDGTTGQMVSLMRPLLGEAGPEDPGFAFVVRRDMRGAFVDTLARLPERDFVTGSDGSPRVHYYRGGPYYDLCDGRLVTGHSDAFRFYVHGPGGEVARIVSLRRERAPLTGEDRAILLRRIDETAQRRGRSPAEVAEWKSRVRFEDTYPAWRRFVCGPAGSILVQRNLAVSETPFEDVTLAERPVGADEWDVFDRRGHYLGVAPFPAPPHRHAFVRDSTGTWLMMGLEWDELEVPYTGVWRIQGVVEN